MNAKKQITIIGGTGNLGVPVVKYLTGLGYEVKLIVRNPEKANKLFPNIENLKVIQADLEDTQALKQALSDTDYLYLNLSTQTLDINAPFCPEREGVANIINALTGTDIKQIIMISGLGAFDNHKSYAGFQFVPNTIRKQGQKLIKNSGIPYTILHCSWFIDSFVLFRRKKTYSVIGDIHKPIYFINAYDYAVQLDHAIGNEGTYFKEYPVQGSEGISHKIAAKQFHEIYSPGTKVNTLPIGIINFLSIFNKDLKYIKHMHRYFKASQEEFLAEDFDTYKTLGKPSLSLKDYAHKVKKDRVYSFLED